MIPLKSFIYFLLVVLPFFTSAQTTGNSRFNLNTPGIQQWFQGWYISIGNDTVHGYIFLSNQIDNQVIVRYSKDNPPGTDEKTLQVSHVKGFRVKDRVYESLPATDKNSIPAFIRRVETGRLNLYAWYNIPKIGTVHDGWYDRPIAVNDEKFHKITYFLGIGDGKYLAVPNSKEFADEMSKIVAGNEGLSQKIAQNLKGYRSGDILNIVQEYNQWYAANKR